MRFQELIGDDLQNRKNQFEKSPNYQSLTPHTKVKVDLTLNLHYCIVPFLRCVFS